MINIRGIIIDKIKNKKFLTEKELLNILLFILDELERIDEKDNKDDYESIYREWD